MNKLSICLLVILLASILGCSSRQEQDMDDPDFKAKIETLTGLDFPDSTKWINYRLESGMDYAFIASFTLAKDDIEKLFEKVEFNDWSDSIRLVRNMKSVKWFKPDDIKKFKCFQANYPKSNAALNVLYDDSNEIDAKQEVLFYMEWIEMW